MVQVQALSHLFKLLNFIDTYASQHPEFRNELEEALSKPDQNSTPKRKKRTSPDPRLDELLERASKQGIPACLPYLQGLEIDEIKQYARMLKIKFTKSAGSEEMINQVLSRVEEKLNRGSAFVK